MSQQLQQKLVVLITGANQGLGFAVLTVAAKRDPEALYLLACRNTEAGEAAIKKLREDGIKASLEVLKLDVTKNEDIEAAVETVSTRYGKLDVLINNAGVMIHPQDKSLTALRAAYTEMVDVNVSSVACMCAAFTPVLYKSSHPRVINITSGLGSMTNALTKKMYRLPPYGASKVALNGLTVHLQVAENERVAAEANGDGAPQSGPKINYYVVAPGFLKTAFTAYNKFGKDPIAGAEVVVQLILSDQYPGGTQWEFEAGKMQEVPW